MLKTTIVAMTLLGCDCDAKQCEYVSDAPGQWASMAECEAAMKRAVLSNSQLDYPLVTGMCRTIEPQTTLVSAPAETIDATLTASVTPDEVAEKQTVVAFVFRQTSAGYQTVMSGMDLARSALVERSIAAAHSVTPVFSRVAGLLPSF